MKHGVSNQFQDRWLQENERHLWLEYHGMDVQGVYKAKCKWCETVFNCHIGTIKTHEHGVKHRAKEQQHQQTATAVSSLQQQLDAIQRRTETERARKMQDPGSLL